MIDLTALTITEAAELIAARELSPVELTQAHLERIERLNPLLNTYITVTAEQALEQASAAEEEIQRGHYRGPLHGIPLGIKDLYATAGIRTTLASKLFARQVPEQDAFAVQKLKEAGAVILGKHNMHEIAMGVLSNSAAFGPVKNPWNTNCSPGGSSGGSAASLAADLCMGALGSDTRGSIRIPAALCGVVGLKPTYGRVSLRGVFPLSWSLDHAGPLARTVRDAALLLQAIAGYDSEDSFSVEDQSNLSFSDIEDGVRGWRIAYARDSFFGDVEPEALEAVENAVRQFEQLGATVEAVDLSYSRESLHSSKVVVCSDAAALYVDSIQNARKKFGSDVLFRLHEGLDFSATDYATARHSQVTLRHRYTRLLNEYHVLLTPATHVQAPHLDHDESVEAARASLSWFTAPFNMAGLPALSLPCGFTSSGLPIGLQMVSRAWAEDVLVRAAHAYEQATDWHLRKPVLHDALTS